MQRGRARARCDAGRGAGRRERFGLDDGQGRLREDDRGQVSRVEGRGSGRHGLERAAAWGGGVVTVRPGAAIHRRRARSRHRETRHRRRDECESESGHEQTANLHRVHDRPLALPAQPVHSHHIGIGAERYGEGVGSRSTRVQTSGSNFRKSRMCVTVPLGSWTKIHSPRLPDRTKAFGVRGMKAFSFFGSRPP